MTSFERIFAAFQLEQPDRVPVSPNIYPAWLDKAGPSIAQKIIQETDPFIGVSLGCDFLTIFLGEEARERVREERLGDKSITTVDTPKGKLRWVISFTDKTSTITESLCKDNKDVEKLLSVPYSPPKLDLSQYNLWKEKIGEEGLVMGGGCDAVYLPWTLFGTENFMMKCLQDFPIIEQLLQIGSERANIFVKQECLAGVKVLRIIGAEITSGESMHPSFFQKLVVSYDLSLIRVIHECDGIVVYHMHGKINSLLEEIADIGVDVLEPIETTPCGNTSLKEAKERIGDRVCLMGNIDDLTVLGSKSDEEVAKAAHNCIEEAGEKGGYILGGTSSGIYTPRVGEGFLTMAKVSRELGRRS